MKAHYLYTKEGAAIYMGYKETRQINSPIKKAIKLGLKPSAVRNGVELFDVSMLIDPEQCLAEHSANDSSRFSEIILKKGNSCSLLDLLEA